ncbi:OsmC family peroxiredoxin [Antarcticibacterium flavum]|uniref:OsmC family peroxiredoxin n=1 Tax=Antarcticibacterium flavum TaxID=2058175 RepID=A0A5B7X1C3_9FLAO|nr:MULTISPECIES: OsmC family protein [Antarcticibacterium]MCM4158623.1 osmotically inducible protein OsmC [Antarcticibacterium sp. W02-3]QCY68478.1 OsmC family peroxiredoxin [Antarcticibacterium flavum]
MDPHTYNVDLTWLSQRKGEISSPELDQIIEVATPPEFPKGMPGIWSPEHLFTAAVSSCFMTTFLAIAENSNLEFKSLSCPAEGILDKKDGKFAMTEVVLKPVVTIVNEADREKAEKIMIKAERACLISNSITSEIKLETEVLVEERQPA